MTPFHHNDAATLQVSWRKFQECRGDPLQGGSGVAVVISVRDFKYTLED